MNFPRLCAAPAHVEDSRPTPITTGASGAQFFLRGYYNLSGIPEIVLLFITPRSNRVFAKSCIQYFTSSGAFPFHYTSPFGNLVYSRGGALEIPPVSTKFNKKQPEIKSTVSLSMYTFKTHLLFSEFLLYKVIQFEFRTPNVTPMRDNTTKTFGLKYECYALCNM